MHRIPRGRCAPASPDAEPGPRRSGCDDPHTATAARGVGTRQGRRAAAARAKVPAMLARVLLYLYLVLLGVGLVLERPAQLAIGY